MSLVVEEKDLNFSQFNCCGDEDLYPFGCPGCGRPMVFCYECDTLYDDLSNLCGSREPVNHFVPSEPIFQCPNCQYAFPYTFMRDGLYKMPYAQWHAAGFGHLLVSAGT